MGSVKLVSFAGGTAGEWIVEDMRAVVGDDLEPVQALSVREGDREPPSDSPAWTLRGVVSNERYVTRAERAALERVQEPLGRAASTRAVLIPVRKSPEWWALTQDERREIFEEQSQHIGLGLLALPAVARRLHHSRDLGEPFDFLTWFEFGPAATQVFDDLLGKLRSTAEWEFVEREVEIRLRRS